VGQLDRLGHQPVHASGAVLGFVVGHGVGGQRQDRRAPANHPFPRPDRTRRGRPVHDRHLHIHQDQVEVVAGARLHGLCAVAHQDEVDAQLAE
jgi:hypothetical protein